MRWKLSWLDNNKNLRVVINGTEIATHGVHLSCEKDVFSIKSFREDEQHFEVNTSYQVIILTTEDIGCTTTKRVSVDISDEIVDFRLTGYMTRCYRDNNCFGNGLMTTLVFALKKRQRGRQIFLPEIKDRPIRYRLVPLALELTI